MKNKVLLYGGTFNPPTKGHMAVATDALLRMRVHGYRDLWFLPCLTNTLFGKKPVSAEHRVRMLEKSIAEFGNEHMYICTYEIELNNNAGTYSVVKNLIRLFPNNSFAFVIGMDEAAVIRKWRNSRKLLRLVPFVVFERAGVKTPNNCWFYNKPHYHLPSPRYPGFSSSQARLDMLLQGTTRKVGKGVLRYIHEHKLYGAKP
jgi:nicotinate-nucleotide adenylyltransferase